MLVLSTILVYDRQVQEIPLVKNPVISHESGHNCDYKKRQRKLKCPIHIHRRQRQRKLKRHSTFTGDIGHKTWNEGIQKNKFKTKQKQNTNFFKGEHHRPHTTITGVNIDTRDGKQFLFLTNLQLYYSYIQVRR